MENNIFTLPANTDYLFNKEKVSKILDDFIGILKNETPTLEQTLAKDAINGDIKIKAKEISSFLKNENLPFIIDFSKTSIKDGIGLICTMYNGNPFITLKLIFLALRTHNQIYLLTNNYLETNKFLISTLDNILEKNKYARKILDIISISENEFFKYQKNFDSLLFIGTKNEYISILPHIKIPIIFQSYGLVEVFVDSKLSKNLKNILLSMDHFAFDNDISLNYIDIDKNTKNLISDLNYFGKDQIIAIFTSNTNTAYFLLNNLKCKKIFINSNPFEKDLLVFDEAQFIFEKEVYFKNN